MKPGFNCPHCENPVENIFQPCPVCNGPTKDFVTVRAPLWQRLVFFAVIGLIVGQIVSCNAGL